MLYCFFLKCCWFRRCWCVRLDWYVGMDAVFRRVSSLWTDGSRLAGGLLAVGLWVRSLGLDCVAVAALVAWFAGCSLNKAVGRTFAPASPVFPAPLATPVTRYDVTAASGGDSGYVVW